MAEKIAQHKHCVMCRKVTSPKSETCGTECEEKWQIELKKRKQLQYFMWIAVAVVIAALVFSTISSR